MISRRKPLVRKTPLKRSGSIRRVSTKRKRELAEYSKLRKEFLARHPYCQVANALGGFHEEAVIACNGKALTRFAGRSVCIDVPKATEIHHKNKRFGSRLNDTSEWLAVSRSAHLRIEADKTWAREMGFLKDF